MPDPIQALLLMLASYLFARPITTTIHELGHLIAALLIFPKPAKITVFLGSLGHSKPFISFNLGRIACNISLHWLWMRGSLTLLPTIPPYRQMALFALAGPLASLLLALGSSSLALGLQLPWALRLGLLLIAFLSLIDLIYAFFHRFEPMSTEAGLLSANDGQMLQWAIRYKSAMPRLVAANSAFLQDHYALAWQHFDALKQSGKSDQEDLHCQAYSAFALGKLEEAASILQEIRTKFKPRPEDCLLFAQVQGSLGKPEVAMQMVEEGLRIAPGNVLLLTQKAWLFMQSNECQKALPLLQKVLKMEPKYGLAMLHLSFCHLQDGECEQAARLWEMAAEQESDNLQFLRASIEIYSCKGNLTAENESRQLLDQLLKNQDFEAQ